MTFSVEQGSEQNGLSLFATTADQRYLLGEEVFLRTHYPMHLRRYKKNDIIYTLSEEELLKAILEPAGHMPGNHIWILYGAPGSGKSEVMRWLETRIRQEDAERAATMVRISRNELHALSIVERFQRLLSNDFLSATIEQQWNMARQKPRALTKLILLFALENLLESDDLINALFYRLLNIIQPHVERVLSLGNSTQTNRALELLSLEAWEAISRETAIPLPFEYEQFRYQLTTAFNAHLLQGLALSRTLRLISQEVQQHYGTRPILLVDDLVQSLNVFASDFLDYFITLEEGNWDVVIGLTPAAFETSQRGRLLLERITHLDTIDDRVEKLWLSDEAGLESYILSEENCDQLAFQYLAEYHTRCGSCQVTPLYPFNRELLVRVYRALPAGKGKPRYFLRHLRMILDDLQKGEPLLLSVEKYARAEYTALCIDKEAARICELYGPIIADHETREVVISQEVLQLVGKQERGPIAIPIEPLVQSYKTQKAEIVESNDEEKVTIRDWLSGKPVNRQLLRTLRQGAARLLRSATFSTAIHYPDIARPYGILSWQKPYLSVNPPIYLEGIDEGVGITITRKVGHVAFDLYRYAHSRGGETKQLEKRLLNTPSVIAFILEAHQYQERMVALLETQIGMPLERFVLSLYVWRGSLHPELMEEVAPLPKPILENIARYAQYSMRSNIREDVCKEWGQLFDDFFKLRENLYDAPRLARRCEGDSAKDIFQHIFRVDATAISAEYRWGSRFLSQEVAAWQQQLLPIQARLDQKASNDLPPHLHVWVEKVYQAGQRGLALSDVPMEVLAELMQESKQLSSGLRLCMLSN
ncbi:hypothetical protein KSC_002540 [Ktedonobacter sp. SOSP1-52]|uniref:ATP-binding protein n=1 Tax=Ktedonobacter sp. SOSP1-52 TaxID=2778366 RepID=UPI001915F623|nr:ATP-binding protein [Ktedonobacter sp. SOSP1-52]GHO61362.1 hypothetical protein KSC_002540 [Ktedonobacter sp. SOSP1-52]